MRSYAETTSVAAAVPATRRAAPASTAQRGLWVTDSLSDSRNGFTVSHAYEIRGPLDERDLVAALQATQDRHDALRTRFELRGERLWQTVSDRAPLDYVRTDLRHATIHRPLAAVAADQLPEPLDLTAGPVFRVQLLVLADQHFLLLLHIHHAVNDAGSMAVIEREISDRYARLPVTEARPRQFWQLDGCLADTRDAAREAAADFWAAELDGVTMPGDSAGENVDRAYHGVWAAVGCTAEYRAAAEAGAALAASPFAILMAATQLAIAMLHDSTDNLVGTAISVRPPGFEDAVGPFVNTVPIRLRIDPMWTAGDAVAAASAALGRVLEHHDVPFEDVLPPALAGESAGRPVTAVTLTSNTVLGSGIALPGLSCRRVEFDSHWCQRDLAVYLNRDGDGYTLRACRSVTRYTQRETVDLLARTKKFLGALAAHPDSPITALGWRAPGDVATATATAPAPTPTLAVVRAAFADVLGIPEADVADDFFDAGGTSLVAIRLSARLSLSIRQIFRLRSMRALAQAIDDRERGHARRS